jgi:hypothetical protein
MYLRRSKKLDRSDLVLLNKFLLILKENGKRCGLEINTNKNTWYQSATAFKKPLL